ncbi:phosphoenolpyruvate carboxylase [Rhizosphaericola mali]|uniref:Phosphoenolpyruvate carboxylase n=1 Tax=Rhizosphaericola mali TaxID=2545455 RepID=A0A5P2G813_9BACT|nr:phosphoenolpyruvate carboxylase [Rhizosphaericola mali]QES89353.1 phosphoenolpyruvate carboxylase [Rhizosphaericola mali]
MQLLNKGNALDVYNDNVGVRFQLYNSLFTALPFHKIEKTGILLTLFLLHCEEGYTKRKSPIEIVDSFMATYTPNYSEQEKKDILFRFIQFTERQVVLFDSLEEAAFPILHDLNGSGSIADLKTQIDQNSQDVALQKKLEDFQVRIVLTAHPTQFYPGEVLGIINDLAIALKSDDAAKVNMYLQQLAKTPFLKKQKPTPFDEAKSLVWYLENIFYPAAGLILDTMKDKFGTSVSEENPIIRMGFWPGGDRDGNPFVRTNTTLKVARELRAGVMRCYYKDIRAIRRRLTFRGVEEIIQNLETIFYNHLYGDDKSVVISKEFLLTELRTAKKKLIELHNGLFSYLLDNLICKVQIFGVFFATLDIRQDSTLHGNLFKTVAEKTDLLPSNYTDLNDKEKVDALLKIDQTISADIFTDEIEKDTLSVIKTIETIQNESGEEGCNRYIISHSTDAHHVIEVLTLFKIGGWQRNGLSVDIMPLFESIEDLSNAGEIIERLYLNPIYRAHLKERNNIQSIMMGFSDGTKDGGYLMANWSIYKAKEEMTKVSRKYDIDVVFFDGRGGPPARGGGKTQKFYASMGGNIENKEIQLTIQGQTVSSNFGTINSAQYNIEQLITAGIFNDVLHKKEETLTEDQEVLLSELSAISYDAYVDLKERPEFLEYLAYATPLRFYGKANIGSRPSKRNSDAKINLDSLRAIPFVGSWSQIKQNIPGYYGVGTAIKKMVDKGKLDDLKKLYQESLFFRTLIDNSEMAMKKCFFPLTEYLSKDPKYGQIWALAYEEYELSKKMILMISGHAELMHGYPTEQVSIQLRDRIVLPIATIQQYAISKVRELESQGISSSEDQEIYEKIVMRCSFGLINAGRNSA